MLQIRGSWYLMKGAYPACHIPKNMIYQKPWRGATLFLTCQSDILKGISRTITNEVR